MLSVMLIVASSVVMLLLGGIHLFYTFFGDQLDPRDELVKAVMNGGELMLTSETTIWRAWVGFNASHSLCAVFFGLVFAFLALAQPDLLFRSAYLQLLGGAVLVNFVVLAKLYWFSIPLIGVSIACACFVAGLAAARV
ncbi:MAG: hypothetical protein EOP21_11915 [Hyphomicrobiales bacterium]|nr:MAG: hypothetical protein EOP21_11915 [Hyphomicrobiales bacterium]